MDEYYALNGGGGFDWDNLVNRGFNTAADIWGRGSHPFSDDPRYRQQSGGGAYSQPGAGGARSQPGAGVARGTGLSLSTNTLMLIAVGVLLFMQGQRRR